MESAAPSTSSGEERKLQNEKEQREIRKESEKQEDSTEGREDGSKKETERKEKRGRRRIAESWERIRSNSIGDIRELITRKRGRNSPEERDKTRRKIAMVDEKETGKKGEKVEEEAEYNEMTDRQLILCLLGKVDKLEKERELDKTRLKQEIKQEIKAEMEEERKMWEKRSVELENRINKRLKEWEEENERKEQRQEVARETRTESRKEAEVEKKIKIMEKRCERLEAEENKKCIIIRGLQKQRRGLEREMEEFFKTKLETEVKVQQASLIGIEKKVIWVKLSTLEDKEKIMERKRKLGKEPIYIEHERTREERDVQRDIVRYAKGLREDGKEVKIKFKRIEVDGKWYRWNEKERNLKEEKQFFRKGTGNTQISLQGAD